MIILMVITILMVKKPTLKMIKANESLVFLLSICSTYYVPSRGDFYDDYDEEAEYDDDANMDKFPFFEHLQSAKAKMKMMMMTMKKTTTTTMTMMVMILMMMMMQI